MYVVIVYRPWHGWKMLGPRKFETVREAEEYGRKFGDKFRTEVVVDMAAQVIIEDSVVEDDSEYDGPTF